MPIKKRCGRCLRPVRPDGTCQNPKCVRYVPEPEKPPESNTNAGSQVSDIGEKQIPNKAQKKAAASFR